MIDNEIVERARTAAIVDLPELIGTLAQAQAVATSRLSAPAPALRSEADELLDVHSAAKRLCVSPSYLYRHHDRFSFVVREGRKLLFSNAGISKYIRNQQIGGK